jgi:flagellar motility protein MotE (MotC chaperone)
MKIRVKDVGTAALASLFLFPVVFVAVLLMTGTVHLSLGDGEDDKKDGLVRFLETYHPKQDSSDAEQSKLFEALKLKEAALSERENRVREEILRLENIKIENDNLKKEIEQHRVRIEQLVGQSKELSDERLDALATVYGNMKPVEAAPILLSMKDDEIVGIIRRIPEVRAQAKLMAAIGAMNIERAAVITQKLGWDKGSNLR